MMPIHCGAPWFTKIQDKGLRLKKEDAKGTENLNVETLGDFLFYLNLTTKTRTKHNDQVIFYFSLLLD